MRRSTRFFPLAFAGGLIVAGAATGCGGGSSGGGIDIGPIASDSGTATLPPTGGTTSPQPSSTGLALSTTTSGPCPSALAGHPLPSDLPKPKHAVVYDYGQLGKTRVWFLSVPGSTKDLQRLRDEYDAALTSRGYEIEGTDQEEGHEAESEFHGHHVGTTNFRGLCTGRDSFRLKLIK